MSSGSTSYTQQWTMETSGNYVKFKNRSTGLYIDGLGKTISGSDLGQARSSRSNSQLWTVSTQAGVKKAVSVPTALNAQIELYPNPFTSSFSLKVENPNEVTSISIYDLMGKQVETIASSAIQENMILGESLNPNMYIVKVNGSGWSQSFKIIKK